MEKMETFVCNCASANLRQTEQLVTQFYDGIMAPSGLYALQFGVLATIFNLGPMSINRLAQTMEMNRSTLSRHLKIMVSQGLLRIDEGVERGTSQVFLTEEGELMLEQAFPLWQEAQDRVEKVFGQGRFSQLLDELSAMRAALNSGAV